MNKAFEKILERLEELQNNLLSQTEGDINLQVGVINGVMYSKKIVQEVAEEYNGGWIPCSERLPEECTEVLVSVKEIDDSFYTRTSWAQDGVWVIKKTPLQPTVIAWQPLPEPYKERD